jgi:vitamin B12 transporter
MAFSEPSYAQQDEMDLLSLYYEEDELLVVSPSRHKKEISQVAENVIVVTAREIKAMGAHTLTDVLRVLTGVQVEEKGGPGLGGLFRIQGSDYRHVLVLIDGVPQNNLSDNIADIGSIPVQNIEKIEIIKGPASSSWGSALGGVVNVITKPAGNTLRPDITLSGSYGTGDTADFRANISGAAGSAGYYIYAGKLKSDGFGRNFGASLNTVYAKFRFDIGENTDIVFASSYAENERGMGEFPDYDFSVDTDFVYRHSMLSLSSSFTDRAEIEVSFRTAHRDLDLFYVQTSSGIEMARYVFDDETNGASANFNWNGDIHTLVIGSDYDENTLESNMLTGETQKLEKWGVFANDTVRVKGVSVTPGIRYEYTDTNGDFLSPSLGITYTPWNDTILRLSGSRGFNIPPLTYTYGDSFYYVPNPDLDVESVWSYQAGLESAALRHLWLKATVFRHDIRDAIINEPLSDGTYTKVNEDRLRKQGVEIEARTAPFHNLSLRGGALLQDTKNLTTGETERNIPEYTADIALEYDDKKSISGSLAGHYIWWNSEASLEAEYDAMIWDLNIRKALKNFKGWNPEVFLAIHNIFNGSQYLDSFFQNPERWIEAGLRIELH